MAAEKEMTAKMTDIMAQFVGFTAKKLPDDVIAKLQELRDKEDSPMAKVIYDTMFRNQELAVKLNRPSCQDTGALQFWVKCGTKFPLIDDVGTGKSFFAGCIANALLEQGVPVLMTNFSRILNALSGLYSEEKNQYIDSLNQYSLLIIDDLGIERSTEFALEQVFNVIDSRYRSKLPLIVTTNMTLEELKNPQDLTRSRIYDRVLERCVPLRINNQNIRQRNAAESMKEARRILAGGTEI